MMVALERRKLKRGGPRRATREDSEA
jgi:hypothetical protein